MIEAFCVNCGHGESDGDVRRTDACENRQNTIDGQHSDTVQTVLHCDHCGTHEEVSQGTLAVERSEEFDLRECSTGGGITVKIDSEDVEITEIDEQVATSVHYTTAGVRSSSRRHLVHIHAVNPPTISKGRHHVQIEDSVDAEMMLADIDYRDENHRTLKFHRDLSMDQRPPATGIEEEVVL